MGCGQTDAANNSSVTEENAMSHYGCLATPIEVLASQLSL